MESEDISGGQLHGVPRKLPLQKCKKQKQGIWWSLLLRHKGPRDLTKTYSWRWSPRSS